MIHVGKERVYNTLDATHEPAATVAPGSVVEIETQLNGGDWLNGVDDLWDPSKSRGPNLATVVAVEGARPGDTLVVEVLDVTPDRSATPASRGGETRSRSSSGRTTGTSSPRRCASRTGGFSGAMPSPCPCAP